LNGGDGKDLGVVRLEISSHEVKEDKQRKRRVMRRSSRAAWPNPLASSILIREYRSHSTSSSFLSAGTIRSITDPRKKIPSRSGMIAASSRLSIAGASREFFHWDDVEGPFIAQRYSPHHRRDVREVAHEHGRRNRIHIVKGLQFGKRDNARIRNFCYTRSAVIELDHIVSVIGFYRLNQVPVPVCKRHFMSVPEMRQDQPAAYLSCSDMKYFHDGVPFRR
jgi:hypothetical protein